MKSRVGITMALVAAGLTAATPLAAQYAGYTTPGSLSRLPQDRKAGVAKAAESARWRWGPFRVEPWVGVRDMSWVDDGARGPDGEELDADFTTTVGAGLRAYVRNGPKVTWAFHFLPEYVYWNEREEQRRELGRYGAGLFGDFNRLGMEITVERQDDDMIGLAESFTRVPLRGDRAHAGLELKITGAFSLYAGGDETRIRSLSDDDVAAGRLSALDRDETAFRGGLRFRFRSGLMLGVGYEQSESDFLDPAYDSSTTGDGIYVEASRFAGSYAVFANVARRQLEAAEGSTFVPTEETFGRIQLQLRPEARVSPSLYAARDLLVSLSTLTSDVIEDRYGASLTFKLGWRTTLTFYGEQGEQEYRAISPELPGRIDDYSSYGGEMRMELGRGFLLRAGYGEASYDSADPFFDRDTQVLRIGIDFGLGGSGWY